jgi:hypothetical protein
MLANILRTDRHAYRPLPADSELVRAIKAITRDHQEADLGSPADDQPAAVPAARLLPRSCHYLHQLVELTHRQTHEHQHPLAAAYSSLAPKPDHLQSG